MPDPQKQKQCGGSGLLVTPIGPTSGEFTRCPGCSHPNCPAQKPGEEWSEEVWVAVAREPMQWACRQPLVSLDRSRLQKAADAWPRFDQAYEDALEAERERSWRHLRGREQVEKRLRALVVAVRREGGEKLRQEAELINATPGKLDPDEPDATLPPDPQEGER